MLKVGAATEVELKEKKHRIEDAVSTTKAAIEEGVVAGGGVTLLRAQAKVLDAAKDLADADEATGARIVAQALEEPLKQIAVNAGLEGGVVVERVRNLDGATEGLNAATGEYEDLVKAGIIDAAKVTRSALQNAASIAALFLTTEAVIADKPEDGAGGGMPGGTWTTSSRFAVPSTLVGERGAPVGRASGRSAHTGRPLAAWPSAGRRCRVRSMRYSHPPWLGRRTETLLDATGAAATAGPSRAPDELIVEEPLEIHLDDHAGRPPRCARRATTSSWRSGFCFTDGLLAGGAGAGLPLLRHRARRSTPSSTW